MPSLSVRVDTATLARVHKRLATLLQQATNLEPVMREAAQYMLNSTVNRIKRTRTAPDGERWAALSDITAQLKGHDRPLFQSGGLLGGIRIADISSDGFMITSDAPHSSYMQRGVKKMRGAFKSKRPSPQVPARPFMGFSDENVRRIGKMLRDHIKKGGGE
ncbi:phage virion morphogenesis protein [Bradyrhizobium sp. YCK136]|uniref:phage virion morphogenesis protein n=1 Tax=Bradyrhizobium sp. YCK136 TaxID=3351346 RepID=UPI0037C6C26A